MLKMQNMVVTRQEQKQNLRIKASSQTLDDDKKPNKWAASKNQNKCVIINKILIFEIKNEKEHSGLECKPCVRKGLCRMEKSVVL